MADKFLRSVIGGDFKVVARGVYTGASGGTVTIPSVDMERTTVNILSSAYSTSTYTGNDTVADIGASVAGSIYVELTNSTTLTIHNQVQKVDISFGGGGSANIVNVNVPVSYEVITYT